MQVRFKALLLSVALVGAGSAVAADATVIGWNNLGMHCMDPDYGVFALLPPYNTLQAQLIDARRPSGDATPPASPVTYEAVADPDGSSNSDVARQDELLGFRRGPLRRRAAGRRRPRRRAPCRGRPTCRSR